MSWHLKTGTIARENPRSFQRKFKIFVVKRTFLRIVSPAFLGLRLVQDFISQMSVSQYYECQVIWKMDTHRTSHIPVFWIIDVKWMNMEVLWGLIRGLHGGPDAYPGINTGLESSKKLKFPG